MRNNFLTVIDKVKLILIVLLATMGLSCSQNICKEILGLNPLLKAGNLILLGEMHGTREAPLFVEYISCNALQKELDVTVFLELPQSDQEQLNLFLQSDGSEMSIRNFLSLNFWSRRYQDGRASEAMFELINSVRILRKAGESIDIVFIDIQNSPDRDLTMAKRILKEMEMEPNNFFIGLTGNMHNRISEGSGGMGSFVVQAKGQEKVVSLKQTYSGGSAWVCLMNEGCGATIFKGTGKKDIGIFIDQQLTDYNGTLAMDSIHASYPAKEIYKY